MEQTKSPLGSLTIFAGLIVTLLGVWGITVDVQTATTALEYADSIVTAIAGLLAIYGRYRATERVVL